MDNIDWTKPIWEMSLVELWASIKWFTDWLINAPLWITALVLLGFIAFLWLSLLSNEYEERGKTRRQQEHTRPYRDRY